MYKKFSILFFSVHLATSVTYAQKPLDINSEPEKFSTCFELYDKGKYGSAQNRFGDVFKDNAPYFEQMTAEYFYASSGIKLFNEDAILLADDFREKYPNHPSGQELLFSAGDLYYSQKDYESALKYFSNVNFYSLPKKQRVEAQFKYGYSLFNLKKMDEAEKQFNDVKKGRHEYSAPASYYAGYLKYRNKNYTDAIEDLNDAANHASYTSVVPALIASCHYQNKSYELLETYATSALERESKVKDANKIRLLLAESYYMQKKFNNAVPLYQQFIEESKSRDADLYYKLGYCLLTEKKYQQAADAFKQINTSDDSLKQYTAYHLGLCYIELDNKPFAITAFTEAKKGTLNRELAETANFLLAKLCIENRQYNLAITELQNFTRTYPESKNLSEANALLSEIFLDTRDYERAIYVIENMKDRNLRVTSAYQQVAYFRGVELYNEGHYTNAIDAFKKSLTYRLNKELVFQTLFYLADSYNLSKNYSSATETYSSVLQNKEFANHVLYKRSYYGMAYLYYNQKKYQEASGWFEKFLLASSDYKEENFVPFFKDAEIRLADCYYVKKDYGRALLLYENHAKETDPYFDYALFQKGIIYSINDKPEEAAICFDKIKNTFPKSRYVDDAQFYSAQTLYEKGFYERAITAYSQLIETKPLSSYYPFSLINRGNCYNNLENYSLAIKDYHRVLDDFINHLAAEDAILNLQQIHNKEYKSAEFPAYYSTFEKANPKSTALEDIAFRASKNLYDGEKYPEAIHTFDQYIAKYPEGRFKTDALFFKGESYYRLKDADKALPLYQQVITSGTQWYTLKSSKRAAFLLFDKKDYAGAIPYYKRTESLAETRYDLLNAKGGLMRSYFLLGQNDSAMNYSKDIENYPLATKDAIHEAKLMQAKIQYGQNQFEKTIDQLKNLISGDFGEGGAEAAYLSAEVLYKQGKHKESIDALFKMNETFPSYDDWIGKAFLLIADNYIATKEFFQAKATLQSILDNAEDVKLKKQADEKLKEVMEMEKRMDGKEETVDSLGNFH